MADTGMVLSLTNHHVCQNKHHTALADTGMVLRLTNQIIIIDLKITMHRLNSINGTIPQM
jgi:hypothetical protein